MLSTARRSPRFIHQKTGMAITSNVVDSESGGIVRSASGSSRACRGLRGKAGYRKAWTRVGYEEGEQRYAGIHTVRIGVESGKNRRCAPLPRSRLEPRPPQPRGRVAVAVVSRAAPAGPGEADEVLDGRGDDPVAAAMRLLVNGEAGDLAPEEWRRMLLGVISARPTPAPDDAPEPVRAAFIDGQLAMRERMVLRAVESLRGRRAENTTVMSESVWVGPLPEATELLVVYGDGTVVAGAAASRIQEVTKWALAAVVRRETSLLIFDLRSMTSYTVTGEGCERVRWRPAGAGWVLRRVRFPEDGQPSSGHAVGAVASRLGCSV